MVVEEEHNLFHHHHQGIVATGGIVNDYADGPAVYRAHIFTSSGEFNVTELSTDPDLPDTVDIFAVGGGGGGGAYTGGGGGGGGAFAVTSYSVSAQPYSIVVGAGGNGPSNNIQRV